MFNNVNFKYSNNVNGGIAILNKFKNEGMPKKPVNKNFKRANTGIILQYIILDISSEIQRLIKYINLKEMKLR